MSIRESAIGRFILTLRPLRKLLILSSVILRQSSSGGRNERQIYLELIMLIKQVMILTVELSVSAGLQGRRPNYVAEHLKSYSPFIYI